MLSLVHVVLVVLGASLGSADILNGTCYFNGTFYASVYTEDLAGYDLGVFECGSTTTISGDGWTDTDCEVVEGANYTAYVTNKTYISSMDQVYSVAVSCERATGSTEVDAGLTVVTPTADSTIFSEVSPTVACKITDDSATSIDATAANTAYIGQNLILWCYIAEEALRGPGGFSIYIRNQAVENEAGQTLSLLEEGCPAADVWAQPTKEEQGVHSVPFPSFYFVPHSGTEDVQTFTSLVYICASDTCNTTTCSGRKRRDVSELNPNAEEEVTIKQQLRIVPYEGYTAPDEVDVTVENQEQPAVQTEHAQECEVCMQKSVMYGVTSLLVILLLLSVAVSCFLFVRTRRSSKQLDYDREMKGSSNPGYHN